MSYPVLTALNNELFVNYKLQNGIEFMEVIVITFQRKKFKKFQTNCSQWEKILYNGTCTLAKVKLHNVMVSLNINV